MKREQVLRAWRRVMSSKVSRRRRAVYVARTDSIVRVPEKLKLYVWDGVRADYDGGIAFALARSVDHARQLLMRDYARGMRCAASLDQYGTEKFFRELLARPSVHRGPYGFSMCGGG